MTTAQIQSNKIQISIVKTMMPVSLLFVVTYTPIFVQILIRNVSLKPIPRTDALLPTYVYGISLQLHQSIYLCHKVRPMVSWYMPSSSVCLYVCLLHFRIVSKQLNVGSRK